MKRLRLAHSTVADFKLAVQQIIGMPIPGQEEEQYIIEFFNDQWIKEQSAILDPKTDERQAHLELGKQLLLKEELEVAWLVKFRVNFDTFFFWF